MNMQIIYERIKSELNDSDHCGINQVTSNKIDIVVISDVFENKDLEERETLVQNWVHEVSSATVVGFISTYTHEEADSIGIHFDLHKDEPDLIEKRPNSWFQLIDWGLKNKTSTLINEGPKTIAFYSYKGGVGRTTALTHVAWILASRGKKVVVVDLDFEAPSLHKAMKLNNK